MKKVYHHPGIEMQRLVSVPKFALLSIISLGLYPFVWMYNEWTFFKQKDNLDIRPLFRSILVLPYLYELLKKIKFYAYNLTGSTLIKEELIICLMLILLLAFLGNNDHTKFISILYFYPLIDAHFKLNLAKKADNHITIIETNVLNFSEILIVIIGLLLWSILLFT